MSLNPEKGYELIIETRDGYLYASVMAERSDLQMAVGVADALNEALATTTLRSVLLVRKGPLVADSYYINLATLFFRNALPKGVRIAFVYDADIGKYERKLLTNAYSEAKLDAGVFGSEQEAVEWLLC